MRTYHWVRCTEFTASLEIPHDYMINTLILQAHLWLIADRLRSFKNSEADYVASIILKLF